nr:[Fe-Fe] hydrogenase large subunit C-terminal domain-containing protein [Maliibacterium massiliense]
MQTQYTHSVTLERKKCKGCTNCIKRCPTEAIRVRKGRARIIDARCIDCGECIRICPYHAKVAVTDPMTVMERYPYKIALPAPTLYGQFRGVTSVRSLLSGLLALGFDDVYEVARGAEVVSYAVRKRLEEPYRERPLISSACPAVLRLIQVRFPSLIDNIVDVDSPMEVAANMAREEFLAGHIGATPEQVGVFFISPCAAKMTSVKVPVGSKSSAVSGVIGIIDLYAKLSAIVSKPMDPAYERRLARRVGVRWANSGGECEALHIENTLAVDGIHNVLHVLEEIDNGKFNDLDFFEGLACTGGCVGGPLTFENGYIAKNRIRGLARTLSREPLLPEEFDALLERYPVYLSEPIEPKPVMQLDDDMVVAMRKMQEMERIAEELPGLDCGSCGSPSCRTHAEDMVRGYATEQDCLFRLRERLLAVTKELAELSRTTVRPLNENEKEDEDYDD